MYNYDGGDFCVCSGGMDDINCQDPGAGREIQDCRENNVTSVTTPCGPSRIFDIKNGSSLKEASSSILCLGENFQFNWFSNVTIESTIEVPPGTKLSISGFENSSANGISGNVMQFSKVDRGYLEVKDMHFSIMNDASFGGVASSRFSDVKFENCSFEKNAAGYGGGFYAYQSSLSFEGDTSCKDGAAYDHGGMIAAYSSDVVFTGNVKFESVSSRYYGGSLYGHNASFFIRGDATFSIEDSTHYSTDLGGMFTWTNLPWKSVG